MSTNPTSPFLIRRSARRKPPAMYTKQPLPPRPPIPPRMQPPIPPAPPQQQPQMPQMPQPKPQQIQPKRISNNTVNKNMSYKYLHIDSRHLTRSLNDTEYTVSLLEPIKNATFMEMISFSTANDLHNIQVPNNRFQMYFRRYADASTDLNQLFNIQVDIPAGFYTHAEMVSTIISLLTSSTYYDTTLTALETNNTIVLHPDLYVDGSGFTAQTTYSVALKMTVLDSGKTELFISQRSSPVTEDLLYGMLVYPYEQYHELFEDSLLHRLGFTKSQVYFTDIITATSDVFLTNGTVINSIDISNNRLLDRGRYTANAFAVTNQSIKGFFRQLTSTTLKILTGNQLAFETHSGLVITNDLIQDIQTTTSRYRSLGKTEFSSMLAHVPIDTNRASWIHHEPMHPHPHKISQPLIREFRLGIVNSHTGRHFTDESHKAFQITLKFHTTLDESIANMEFYDSIQQGMFNYQYEN